MQRLSVRLLSRPAFTATTSLRSFATQTPKTHEELVQAEFAQQANRSYDVQSASSAQMISWILSALPPLSASARVLDVAAGTGRMRLIFSQHR